MSREAQLRGLALATAALLSMGASYRTTNFLVSAPSPDYAREVGETAEQLRVELANEWLGQPLDDWSEPCPINVNVGSHLGAGGATSFMFDRGEVFGWRMTIQGPADRILDSVLPHEVTHTVFATHFRQPLPRWADEGACTTVEHSSERAKQDQMLVRFLKTQRGIPFSRMFAMKEYPADLMPLYSQGYSLARFLIDRGGKRKFIAYLGDGMRREQWVAVTRRHYGFDNLAELQDSWLAWVRRGSPPATRSFDEGSSTPIVLASDTRSTPSSSQLIYRAQSADTPIPRRGRLVPIRWPRESDRDAMTAADAVDPSWRPSGLGELASPPDAVAVGPAADSQLVAAAGNRGVAPPRRTIFEWRRNDVPSALAPTDGTGPVYTAASGEARLNTETALRR